MNQRRRWKAKARRAAARETQLGTPWYANPWINKKPRTIYDPRVLIDDARAGRVALTFEQKRDLHASLYGMTPGVS